VLLILLLPLIGGCNIKPEVLEPTIRWGQGSAVDHQIKDQYETAGVDNPSKGRGLLGSLSGAFTGLIGKKNNDLPLDEPPKKLVVIERQLTSDPISVDENYGYYWYLLFNDKTTDRHLKLAAADAFLCEFDPSGSKATVRVNKKMKALFVAPINDQQPVDSPKELLRRYQISFADVAVNILRLERLPSLSILATSRPISSEGGRDRDHIQDYLLFDLSSFAPKQVANAILGLRRSLLIEGRLDPIARMEQSEAMQNRAIEMSEQGLASVYTFSPAYPNAMKQLHTFLEKFGKRYFHILATNPVQASERCFKTFQ
jgi:hypothetical protein